MICLRFLVTIGLYLLAAGVIRAGEDVKSVPRMVEVELLIAETARAAVSEKGPLNLSAPAEKLRASLLELEEQGKLAGRPDSVLREQPGEEGTRIDRELLAERQELECFLLVEALAMPSGCCPESRAFQPDRPFTFPAHLVLETEDRGRGVEEPAQ